MYRLLHHVLTLSLLFRLVWSQGATSSIESQPVATSDSETTPFKQFISQYDEPLTMLVDNDVAGAILFQIPANGTDYPDVLITLTATSPASNVDIYCKPASDRLAPTPSDHVWKSDHSHGQDYLFISRFHPKYREVEQRSNGILLAEFVCTLFETNGAITFVELKIDLDYFFRDLVKKEQRALEAIFEECCQEERRCMRWKEHMQLSNANEADFCHFEGNVCNSEGHLVRLNLDGMNMKCPFPGKELIKLQFLQKLQMRGNALTGDIREVIKQLLVFNQTDLIEISGASFMGPLSENDADRSEPICRMARGGIVKHLELVSCNISGSLPVCLIDESSRINELNLAENKLTGQLPTANLTDSTLFVLSLANNQLTGRFPLEWLAFPRLRVLDLSMNQLRGRIPKGIGSLNRLLELNLSGNRFNGNLPDDITTSPVLRVLDIGACQLTGTIPKTYANNSQLLALSLYDNSLSGEIPDEISQARSLRLLDLRANKLTGKIPDGLFRISTLGILNLAHNKLRGPLPVDLAVLENLYIVLLNSNALTGTIPDQWRHAAALQFIRLDDNKLSGTVPGWLHSINFPRLRRLSLNISSNRFNAFDETWFQQRLDIPFLAEFYAADNEFTGEIPPLLANHGTLLGLDLARNKMSGPLPSDALTFSRLRFLNLSSNAFTGQIPSIWSQSELFVSEDSTTMDLSHNDLSGTIPSFLLRPSNSTVNRKFYLAGNAFDFKCPLTNALDYIQDLTCTEASSAKKRKNNQSRRASGMSSEDRSTANNTKTANNSRSVVTLSDPVPVRNEGSATEVIVSESESSTSVLALVLATVIAVLFAMVVIALAIFIRRRKKKRANAQTTILMADMSKSDIPSSPMRHDKAHMLQGVESSSQV